MRPIDGIRPGSGSLIYTILITLLLWIHIVHVDGINNNNIDSSHQSSSGGGDAKNTLCIPGLYTWGATSPPGDIKLQVGDTLEVNCTIDRSSPKVGNLTSANIEFSFTKHDIAESAMKVTIVDDTTAMLRVKNMNVSTPLLYCSLINPHKNNSLIHVCQNQINVGYPPLEVENLRCLAKNWNSLNCTWTKPFNPVFTNYHLNFRLKAFYMACGHASEYNKTFSCEWNGLTDPHYQPSFEYYNLIMNGSNVLKPDGVLWSYKIHHWAIIIPAKPEKVIAQAVSPDEIEVTWEFVNYEHFKPGLLHRVTVCATQNVDTCLTKNFKSRFDGRQTQRIRVPYANMPYRVEVRMKSAMANDTEEFWSAPTVTKVQTLAKKPDSPPRTTAGSFQVFNKYQIRDVFVYWQNIEVYQHNGSDFRLKFRVYENGRLNDDIRPTDVTSSHAVFANMTMQAYKFEIAAVNSMGMSESFATVQVPSSTPQGPPAPLSVTKMFYSNGTYEISWKPPPNAEDIISYTIFVCNGSRHSPYQCSVLLDWNEVGADQTMFIYKDLPTHQVFQFGVSVNTRTRGSSEMVLANCELVFNKVPGKITDVRIGATSPNAIQVKWNLDCAYKPGRIEGFRVTYCLVGPSSADTGVHTCPDVDHNKHEIRASPDDSEYSLKGLKPFSMYMLTISIITKAGESETSDPVFGTTAEAAPSDLPHVHALDSTNTSGVLVFDAPATPNGVLQKFRIIYGPVDEDGKSKPLDKDIPMSDLMTTNQQNKFKYNLTELENNLNYSVSVMACTVSCSNASEPAFLMTKVGSTKLTKSPTISYQDETFIINWDTPARTGGPVDHFEVAVRRNGEFVSSNEPYRVNFKPGQTKYEHQLHLQCETNTTVSVQVRAVSFVEGELLYGDWSPEGSLSCSGVAAWILWLIGLGIATILVVVIAVLSRTFRKQYRIWKGVTITYPFEVELEGVQPEVKKMRQNSGGDTHSLGKENMIYKLYLAATQSDETKDFLPSDATKKMDDLCIQRQDSAIYVDSSVENNSLGSSICGVRNHVPLQESIDEALKLGIGKVCDWSWQPPSMIDGEADLFAINENSNSLTVENPFAPGATAAAASANLSSSSNQSSTVDEGNSPSPSKPLLSDSIHYADADEDDDHDSGEGGGDEGDAEFIPVSEPTELEHYKKLGYKRDEEEYRRQQYYAIPKGPPGPPQSQSHNHTQSHSAGTPTPSPSSRSHSSSSSGGSSSKEESQPTNHQPPQSSSSALSSASSLTPTTGISMAQDESAPVIPKVPITNPYITWTYLKNEPVTDDGGEGVDNPLKQPTYYQVGITMDSA